MILPTKHIRTDRALIGVGAHVLRALRGPMTVSKLWDEIRARRTVDAPNAVLDYRWFVLALDFLYTVRTIDIEHGLIRKARQ